MLLSIPVSVSDESGCLETGIPGTRELPFQCHRTGIIRCVFMGVSKYMACICEGAAESEIMDILVDHETFFRDEMLDERVSRCGSAKTFKEWYLRKHIEPRDNKI